MQNDDGQVINLLKLGRDLLTLQIYLAILNSVYTMLKCNGMKYFIGLKGISKIFYVVIYPLFNKA